MLNAMSNESGLRVAITLLALAPIIGACFLVTPQAANVIKASSSQALLIHRGKPSQDTVRLFAVDDLRLSHGVWAEPKIIQGINEDSVELQWRLNPGAQVGTRGPFLAGSQLIQAQGWITSVAAGEAGELMIASKLPNGETRIEKCQVATPLVVTPEIRSHLIGQPVISRSVVYQGSSAGKDTVNLMVRKRGQANAYLVQFFDSKDLYVLDAAASPATLTLLLDADSHPEIVGPFNSVIAGQHRSSGNVYHLSNVDHDYFRVERSVYMIDSDVDGVFEVVGDLDASVVESLKLVGLVNWIEYLGMPTDELLVQ